MHDVIGTYHRLDEQYRSYLSSAFPLRSGQLASERDALLRKPEVLSQVPLIETVPIYEPSGLDIAAAARELGSEYSGLSALGSQLIPAGLQLYRHQWEALRQVIQNGQDLVVTTGTGSGKTECFLLPLLAQLARESLDWPAPGPLPSGREWWQGGESAERVPQWAHLTRATALRAVILYPLNALVEDQLRRLRGALDDDRVHNWLNSSRKGNRILFGRYTGQTPIAGVQKDTKLRRLKQELQELDDQRRDIVEALNNNRERYEDVQFHFPRLDGGEMWSRWDMQETPPDILITNYSMLNIMLMRGIESPMFERTRRWLAEPGHPERQFFLVVDELHAYRGTPGTEVAYIIRLLLARLGLGPESPNLRILTTTASLDEDDKGRKFLREFFGRDRFAFITGEEAPPPSGARVQLGPYQGAFEEFARAVQPDVRASAPDEAAARPAMANLALQLTARRRNPSETEETYLGSALEAVRASDVIRDAATAVTGSVRATKVTQIDPQVFPASPLSPGAVASDAMRGLLLAWSSALSGGRE